MPTDKIDRAKFQQAAPGVVAALRALNHAIADSGLDKTMVELLKVRVSQLNGCAFCLAMHVDQAREAGVSQQVLDLVATWREAAVFNAREKAALAWTEALTFMAARPVPDAVYQEIYEHFSLPQVAFLTSSIALINAWNRIAGGLRFAPVAVP